MKKFIVLVFIVLSASLSAQIPATINLRIADSEIKGLFGLEFQISKFSISGGWRPGSTPLGDRVNSWDFAFTVYQKHWYESGFYVSVGTASEGIVHHEIFNGTYTIERSGLILVGFRMNANDVCYRFNDRLTFDVGAGYNGSAHADLFSFEVVVNYSLFKPRYRYR